MREWLATIASGGRLLAGVDPGYIVCLPLLVYNTTMGIALNLPVFGILDYLYTAGSAIATDSIRAMTFRTSVWLLLFLGLTWLGRRRHASGT